jgi:hypothetical protein
MTSANQTKPQRFAPPRDAIAVDRSALRVHDWVYVSGYWYRIVAIAPSASAFAESIFTLHRPGQRAPIDQLTTDLRHAALFKRDSDKRAKP